MRLPSDWQYGAVFIPLKWLKNLTDTDIQVAVERALDHELSNRIIRLAGTRVGRQVPAPTEAAQVEEPPPAVEGEP